MVQILQKGTCDTMDIRPDLKVNHSITNTMFVHTGLY